MMEGLQMLEVRRRCSGAPFNGEVCGRPNKWLLAATSDPHIQARRIEDVFIWSPTDVEGLYC